MLFKNIDLSSSTNTYKTWTWFPLGNETQGDMKKENAFYLITVFDIFNFINVFLS